MVGSAPQLNDIARPCLPITLSPYHLVSSHCLFYLKHCRLKLSNDACNEALSGILGNVILKFFHGGKPPDPLCCLSGTIKEIGYSIASVARMVIRTFLIGDPKRSLYIWMWLSHPSGLVTPPPRLLTAGFVTGLAAFKYCFFKYIDCMKLSFHFSFVYFFLG